MITFLCSKCNKQHSVPDEWAGKSARCPCGAKLSVPYVVKLVSDDLEPEDDQRESEEDNEFSFDPNDLSSIPSTTRTYRRKQNPWWVPVVKLLSAAAVVALIGFFGYPYYSPQLKKFFSQTESKATASKTPTTSPHEEKQTQNQSPKKSTKLASAKETVPNKKSLKEDEDSEDSFPIEEEIRNITPRAERPFSSKVAEVILPSGRTISALLLSPPEETELAILQIRDTLHYYLKDDNGRICAVCQYDQKSRKIEGLVLRTHTNGTMSSLASFKNSKRDGPLYCWNEHGQICHYCDWVNGKKQGLACLFNDEKPILVQEWKADELITQYQVEYQNVNDLAPSLKSVPLDSQTVKPLEKQIATLEHKLDEQDINLRRCFIHDFKRLSQDIRIAAAPNSSQHLAQIQPNQTAEVMKEQAAETAFWQQATTGAQWSAKQRWLAPKAQLPQKR